MGQFFPFGPPISRWPDASRSIEELTRSQRTQKGHLLLLTVLEQGLWRSIAKSLAYRNTMNFDTLRMVDLHLSVWAQKHSIPIIMPQR